MTALFSPLTLRKITFKNRIFVSPMCQYSSVDGLVDEWHLVHLGSRAVGGAALVLTEATAVSPEGRISPQDAGIWTSAQSAAFKPISTFIKKMGSVPGIQLAHAGRKASTAAPWHGRTLVEEAQGGWQTIAPSAIRFADDYPSPRAMNLTDIERVVLDFRAAAARALSAGFQVIEIHAAHGYLLHEFLSPISNKRSDSYGGSLENRMRLVLDVIRAVREVWPDELPLFLRISATDWVEGGWDLAQSVALAKAVNNLGVDLIDCSSGALVPHARIPLGPGYQAPFAESLKREAGIATGAVGLLTEPEQANAIIENGTADAVLLARAFLKDPYWPLHAAEKLGVPVDWPVQYKRAGKS